jgi:hypothetical protein
VAKGSLGETQDDLQDALQSRYITPEEFDEMWKLSKRCRLPAMGSTAA